MNSHNSRISTCAWILCMLFSTPLLEAVQLTDFRAPATVKGGNPIAAEIVLVNGPGPLISQVDFHVDRPDVVPVLDFRKIYTLFGTRPVEFPTRPVSVPTTVQLTATFGRSLTAQVIVLPPVPTSLTFAEDHLIGGSLVTATVTLDGPASFSGFPLRIECLPAGLAMAPETVAVPPEETRVEFQILLAPTALNRSMTVRVISDVVSVESLIDIYPPNLIGLAFDPPEVRGGEGAEGAIELDTEAPPGGLTVTLKSSKPQAASVESTLLVDAGRRRATFPIATSPQEGNRGVNLTASLGSAERTSSLTVLAPELAEVSLSPNGAVGGRPARGRVRLTSPAAVDTTVALASLDIDLALVPDHVVVPQGETTVQFRVSTGRVFSDAEAMITAAYSGKSLDGSMKLVPARRGDWEGDGDVDLLDFAEFQVCFTGSRDDEGFQAPSTRCAGTFDFDADGDVDHPDFEEMIELMIGPADGVPDPTVEIDGSLLPEVTEVPGIDGGPSRPVAVLADAAGNAMDFVEEELVIEGSDELVDPFLARWRGNVVDSYDPESYGFSGPKKRLVKIDTQRADLSTLIEDLRALNPDRTGELRLSSEAGALLLAVAAREQREGMNVVFNTVPRLASISQGTAKDGKWVDPKRTFDFDAFLQDYFRSDNVLHTGVTEAWKMLDQTNRLSNKVPIAIIDRGFSPNADFPPNTIFPNGSGINPYNPKKPWHGTKVSSILVGQLDNGYGTAGVAGPVAGQVIALTNSTSFDIGQAILEAMFRGAKIINISLGGDVPAVVSLYADNHSLETRLARKLGVLIFAGAGNENTDVDAECCVTGWDFFGGLDCWECAWQMPCENDGVICVGAMKDSASYRANPSDFRAQYEDWASNWGSKGQVPLWAPNEVHVGPTPSNPQLQISGGTSMASPFAAGVAALVWAAEPTLNADQVQGIIFSTAFKGDWYARNRINAEGAVLEALGGDRPPSIEIIEPRSGGTYPQTFGHSTRVVFYAAANDPEGLPLLVTWRSDRQGLLGFGASMAIDNLSPGQHVITASALDAARFIATDQVTIHMQESVPEYRIYEPLPGKQFLQGQSILVHGETFDPRTGGRLPDAQAGWYLGGAGTPAASGHKTMVDTAGVAIGTVTLSFPKRDEGPGTYRPAQVAVEILPPPLDLPPTAVIDVPAEDIRVSTPACTTKDVLLQGRGFDPEDGESVRLTWITDRSDLQDPVLGQGPQITAKLKMACTGGITYHRIWLRVADQSGNEALSQSSRLVTIFDVPK